MTSSAVMVNEKTLDAYKTAGVNYTTKAEDDYLKMEREKCSVDLENYKQGQPSTVKRKITAMYRHRTNEGVEHLLYNQTVTATANYSRNEISWHEKATETSMYFNPIPEHHMTYDQETEKQTTQVRQIQHTDVIFTIPFNEEEVMKLKPLTNLATKYYVSQQDALTRNVSKFEDWLRVSFDDLMDDLTQEDVKERERERLLKDGQSQQLEQQQLKSKVPK